MRARVKIIANPVSGSGRGARLARDVFRRLVEEGGDPELVQTGGPGDARRHASRVDGHGAVAGLGGDGTVNEILNGLPDAGAPPLAMVPCGTANVLAKELRLPRSARALARLLRAGREVRWDLGVDRASRRKFLLFLSAGYDAHVVHVFHARRTGPIRMWQYLLWGLRSVLCFEPPRIGVELDGADEPVEASWVQVSNVASYGGPLVFTPEARPGDGRFEVMIFRGRRRRDVLRMFWRALVGWLTGADLRLGGLAFRAARRVRLRSLDGRPVPAQVDGDPSGHLPADVELVPGGIRLLAPSS